MADVPACALCGGETRELYADAPDYLSGQTFAVRRCAACGLAFTWPRPADLDPYYPAFYRRFSPVVFHVLREIYTWKVASWVRRFGTSGRALEVGCGSGWMLAALKARGWEVVGSERAFPVAASVRESQGLPMFVGGPEAVREDAGFDLVVLFQVLEHLPDPMATLAACARLVRPGGALVVAVPNVASWQARATGRYWQHLDVPRHLWHFTRPCLTQALSRVGLTLETVSYASFEHDPFGWVMSLLNRMGFPQNRLIQWLQGQDRASLATASGLLNVLLAALLAVPALLAALVSWLFEQGALMEVTARRAPSPPAPCPLPPAPSSLTPHPSPPSSSTSTTLAFALLLSLTWLAYAGLFWNKGLPQPDSGYVFQHGRELVAGKVLYRDILPHIPPVTPLVQAAWIRILGPRLLTSSVHFVLSYGLILLLSFLLLSLELPPAWAYLFSLSTMTLCGALLPSFSWYNYDASITFLLGAYLLLRFDAAFCAGLAFGLCILTKTNFGAIGTAIGLLYAASRGARPLLRYVSGLLLPLLIFVAWLFTCSDPASFKMLVVTGQVDSKGGLSLPLNLLRPLVSRTGVLAPLLALGATLALTGRYASGATLAALALVAWAPLVPYLYGYYAAQIAGFALLAAALLLALRRAAPIPVRWLWITLFAAGLLATDSLSQLAPWIHNACSFLSLPVLLGSFLVLDAPVRRPLLIALALLTAGLGAHSRFARPYNEPPLWNDTYALTSPGLQGISIDPARGQELDHLVTRILAEPGDLLVYPEGSSLYVATGKLCPTRIANFAPTYSASIGTYFQDGEIARLAAHPPRYLAYVKPYDHTKPTAPFDREQLLHRNRFPKLSQWLADHYAVTEDLPHYTLLTLITRP